jgi:hypothetical protein
MRGTLVFAGAAALALQLLASAQEDAPQATSEGARWVVFADCAAGYAGNVEARKSDPGRTPEMRDMVAEIGADYEAAAARILQAETGSSMEESDRIVREHVEANVARFMAMDAAGELDAWLEACPDPYEEEL